MAGQPDPQQIEVVRRFNRFYTRRIGVLEEGLLKSPFTLTQARVLFELGTRRELSASEIRRSLGLDFGYLSRILQELSCRGLVKRKRCADDGRRALLSLTAEGREALRVLEHRSQRQVWSMLSSLPDANRNRLLAALRTVQEELSDARSPSRERVLLRPYRMGDLGWALELHARLYAEEYGWNEEFEALVAKLFARFANERDPAKERFWTAELEGERVGCVFVVRNDEDPTVAQLRCLLVDPKGRGLGIGRRLVAECIAFARSAGYRRIMLWTNDVLVAARRIYETAGFTLAREEPHHSFGHDLLGQFWTLELGPSTTRGNHGSSKSA